MNFASALPQEAARAKRSSGVVTDETLLQAVANGDSRAMQTLYTRHNVRVFRFVMRLVGDRDVAEDVVSEVFVDVWRRAGDFEGRSQVSTWMLSIARFKALSARRRRHDDALDEAAAESIADSADTPEETVLKSDRNATIRLCMGQLSADHREIIDLVYYHGKTIEEVADVIHAPKNTVKTRMFYARKRLAQLVAEYGEPASGMAHAA